MQPDTAQRLTELRTILKGVEERRAATQQDMRSHVIVANCYRNILDQFAESDQFEICQRLAAEERGIVRAAVAAWKESIDVCREAILVLDSAATHSKHEIDEYRQEIQASESCLIALKERSTYLDFVLGE